MKIGYIGLGRMGKNMVSNLLTQGVEVVAWNRSKEPLEEVRQLGAIASTDIPDLISKLETPRIIWLMLPAGEVVDDFIDQLVPHLAPHDLIIDGGNSFYKDSIRRGKRLAENNVHFMDIGTSGGPDGALKGACLMIGGSSEDFDRIKELAKTISAPKAFGHFGPVGAGHFAKMVHNGIEYGMMEAIAEGLAVLKTSQFGYDLSEVLRVYNRRSVVESRLIEWTQSAFLDDPTLSEISSVIKSTGEGEWTINTAKELGVDVPVIEDSFKVRQNSDKDPEDSPAGFRNRVVSAMRGQFGKHDVKKAKKVY